jgi:hypothetical protein
VTPDEETAMAFVVSEHEQPAIEIRVNFGILAGREATPAEIDHLAGRLLDEVETVTIVAEERHEIGKDAEASVHLVRIELSADQAPDDPTERARLEGRLAERADHWVRACVADRPRATDTTLPPED